MEPEPLTFYYVLPGKAPLGLRSEKQADSVRNVASGLGENVYDANVRREKQVSPCHVRSESTLGMKPGGYRGVVTQVGDLGCSPAVLGRRGGSGDGGRLLFINLLFCLPGFFFKD